MKHLKTYNESIRDYLKPKSEEDVQKYISGLSKKQKIYNLFKAVDVNEDIPMVKIILDSGMDVNTQDTYGYTPLMYAVTNYNIDMIEFLLNRGADVSIESETGRTALFTANELLDGFSSNEDNIPRYKYIIELLKKHGATK